MIMEQPVQGWLQKCNIFHFVEVTEPRVCFCFCEEQCALSLLNKLRFSWNWVQFRLMVGELIMSMIVVTTSLEQLYHQPTDWSLPSRFDWTCYSFLCGNKILSKPLTSLFFRWFAKTSTADIYSGPGGSAVVSKLHNLIQGTEHFSF